MAKSRNNVVTHGLSGKVGNMLVFKQLNGNTIVSNRPRKSGKPASDKQVAQTQRFAQAIIYAKAAMSVPEIKLAYAAATTMGITPFNVAMADKMKAPEIQEVNVVAYTGKIGDVIVVKATDDFKVTQVTVEIQHPDGSLVEKGDAVLSETGLEWQYKAVNANNAVQGCKVIARAMDLPGNVTELEQLVA